MFAVMYGTVLHETLCIKRNWLGLPVHKNGLMKCSVSLGWKIPSLKCFIFMLHACMSREKHFSLMLYLIIYCAVLLKMKVPQTPFWNRYDQVIMLICIEEVYLYTLLRITWRWFCCYLRHILFWITIIFWSSRV